MFLSVENWICFSKMVIFQNGKQTVKFLGGKKKQVFLVYISELPILRNVQTHAYYKLSSDTIKYIPTVGGNLD